MTVLDDYAQRVDGQNDPSNLLGRLTWYGLSEMRVPHEDFAQMLTDIGIVDGHPRQPSDADVFRRVCTNVKRVKVATSNPDVFENYRMVEFKDDDTITRRVVRERVNNAGRKLGFTELFDVVFDRETNDLVMKQKEGTKLQPHSTAASIQDEIIDQYYLWRGCLNAQAIREWMRNHLMGDLGATMVRPGMYFIRETHRPVIEGFEQIGEVLADMLVDSAGKVEFHSLPLIDDRKQREMIQRAFEAETVDAVDALLEEIAKISKSDKPLSADRYTNLLGEYQELNAKTKDYEELLEQKLASTGKRLEIFQASLLGLRKKVKV